MSGMIGVDDQRVAPRRQPQGRAWPVEAAAGLAAWIMVVAFAGCGGIEPSASVPSSGAPATSPAAASATATPIPTATPAPTLAPTASPTPGNAALTQSMAVARTRHTATLLQDGRVLIAGGSSKAWSNPSLASAELFDPRTGTFGPTGLMTVRRAGHTATLLKDGRVLIAGGHSVDVGGVWLQKGSLYPDMGLPLASAELYDPATGKFTATGSMAHARDSHNAALLPDGRVLVAGGFDCSAQTSCEDLMSAEIYDPATGKFSPTGSVYCGGRSTPLKDGRILIVTDCDGAAQVYDPATGAFSGSLEEAAGPDDHGAISLLADGRVLLTGGYIHVPEHAPRLLNTAQLYDPSTGMFSATGSLTMARASHSSTLLPDGRVLIAGGGDAAACRSKSCPATTSSSTELYDPATGRFTPARPMSAGRFDHTATLLRDGRVLIVGGYSGSSSGSCLVSAELYSL